MPEKHESNALSDFVAEFTRAVEDAPKGMTATAILRDLSRAEESFDFLGIDAEDRERFDAVRQSIAAMAEDHDLSHYVDKARATLGAAELVGLPAPEFTDEDVDGETVKVPANDTARLAALVDKVAALTPVKKSGTRTATTGTVPTVEQGSRWAGRGVAVFRGDDEVCRSPKGDLDSVNAGPTTIKRLGGSLVSVVGKDAWSEAKKAIRSGAESHTMGEFTIRTI